MPYELPRDSSGAPIQASSDVSGIQNVAINNTSRVAVVVPWHCKAIILRARSGSDVYLYENASSSEFFTLCGDLSMNIHPTNETSTTIFYVKASIASDVLEIIVLS